MKRLLPVALMIFLSFPALAGDIQNPGKTEPPPPPPPVNTTNSTDGSDSLTELVLWLLLMAKP